MSKSNRPRLSLPDDRNAPTTVPIEPPPEEMSALIQEKQMEVPQEAAPEPTGPTAKQMARIEEENAARVILQKKAEEMRAIAAEQSPVSLIGVAAQGMAALQDKFREHNERAKNKAPYVPPPMTDRQKTALREEMEAGARRVATAEAQKIRAGHPILPSPAENNEGVTIPVHRPADFVPGLNSSDPARR